jgi:hypothetical protein
VKNALILLIGATRLADLGLVDVQSLIGICKLHVIVWEMHKECVFGFLIVGISA